jgi:hypothetical protein
MVHSPKKLYGAILHHNRTNAKKIVLRLDGHVAAIESHDHLLGSDAQWNSKAGDRGHTPGLVFRRGHSAVFPAGLNARHDLFSFALPHAANSPHGLQTLLTRHGRVMVMPGETQIRAWCRRFHMIFLIFNSPECQTFAT